MPELPEVEHVRRELQNLTVGKTIQAVKTCGKPKWEQAEGLAGGQVTGVRRRGKYLHLDVIKPGQELTGTIHLGMSGKLTLNPEERSLKHLRVQIDFENGQKLTLEDPRGFGAFRVDETGEEDQGAWAEGTYNHLGLEPLEDGFDPTLAGAILAMLTAGKDVKTVLLDQRAIAGVGNYIADEALYRAGIHPQARGISEEAGERLAQAVREICVESLQVGGMSEKDYFHLDGTQGQYANLLKVRGRGGQACLNCQDTLEQTRVGGRGTVYCPTCQPLPNGSADQ